MLLVGGVMFAAYISSLSFGPKLDAFRADCSEKVKGEALDFFGLEGGADIFCAGYFFYDMPGQLPVAVQGRDAVRTDIGAALVCYYRNGRIYMYLKQFSLISKDMHEQSMVLMPSEIAAITGEPALIPCRTPRGRIVQIPAQRLVIRSTDGAQIEARLSGGAIEAAEIF